MRTITCASYFGTGSSAITDFISEFNGVNSMTNYEFRFIHDPDGISELEYNLVENFNRHNSGHALKRYKKLVDYYGNHFLVKRYEPFFQNQWKKLSYQYIDDLTDFKFQGSWQYDYYDEGPWFEFWHKLPARIIRRVVRKLFHRVTESDFGTMKKCITYGSHPTEEKFLECTRKYTDALLKAANQENAPILMVDQILPSSNIERHMRYFSDIRAIVVDRDPRDQYYLTKYSWKNPILPKDLDTFCKWYAYARSTRKEENWDSEKILFIQFEDLVYNYDETTQKIMDWVGLKKEDHVRPRTAFNPEISIKNTRLWEKHPEFKAEAEEIARRLPEYIYEGNK